MFGHPSPVLNFLPLKMGLTFPPMCGDITGTAPSPMYPFMWVSPLPGGTECGVHTCAPTESLASRAQPVRAGGTNGIITPIYPLPSSSELFIFTKLLLSRHRRLHASQSTPSISLHWVHNSPGCLTAVDAVGVPPRPLVLAGAPFPQVLWCWLPPLTALASPTADPSWWRKSHPASKAGTDFVVLSPLQNSSRDQADSSSPSLNRGHMNPRLKLCF